MAAHCPSPEAARTWPAAAPVPPDAPACRTNCADASDTWSKGFKVWVNAMPRPVYADGHFDKVASLRDHVEQGVGREKSDRYAVEHLRRQYGVWP